MNSNYISTESLYDSGAHLAHARTYSHKYIKREPDGKGGFRYIYPTDVGNTRPFIGKSGINYDSKTHNTSYNREHSPSGQLTYLRKYKNNGKDVEDVSFAVGRNGSRDLAKNYRQAAKAGQIYKENEKDTRIAYNANNDPRRPYKDALVKGYKTGAAIGESVRSAVDSIKNVASTAVDSITTTAKDTYDKGTNFLKNLFSQPIVTTEKKWYINDELVKQETTSGRRKSRK